MSSSEGNLPRPEAAFAALERAVLDAVVRLRELEGRVRDAEAAREELGRVVGRISGGGEEAAHLLARLGRLEEENADLRDRIDEGRAGVERLLARIRFLEEKR